MDLAMSPVASLLPEYVMSILGAVQTAVSGLNAQSHAFTDLSNNIANSSTVGYKATSTSFQDYVTDMSQARADGASQSDSVLASTEQHNDNQGTIATSSNPLALAISGNGFFNVQKTVGETGGDSEQYYTRNGDFSLDANGYLKNSAGYYLEGFSATSTSNPPVLAPLQVNNSATNFEDVTIHTDGSVVAQFSDNTSQTIGTIPLTTFSNVNGLEPQDGQAYTATTVSGNASGPYAVNTNGTGSLVVGSLESSTTDLTGNLTQLIVDQQAYGANTKVVSTANQLLQTTLAMIQ